MTPRSAFLRACALDVAVRKPGNVSRISPGHGMQAQQFIVSAQAAAAALCDSGASVGARIEGAVAATQAAVGCNTNLGIVLLCAPIACAAERSPAITLRAAIAEVLASTTVDDAAAAYRAIAAARPGGLGTAPSQDVHAAPSVSLRAAMSLAAERDRIARQYRDGYAELFDLALPALAADIAARGFSLSADAAEQPDAALTAAVQGLYLLLLASGPDSHIVRKHGSAVAQNVMTSAQRWRAESAVQTLDADPAFAAWDEALKAQGFNPGTTADLTVATLMLSGLMAAEAA
jgi:triphosphoribosyl-dephospho-CoA synthase